MRLIIDKSSYCSSFLHTHDEEYGEDLPYGDGKTKHIPSLDHCMNAFEESLTGILSNLGLNFKDIICVCDPVLKDKRKSIRSSLDSSYKQKDPANRLPIEFYELREVYFEALDDFFGSNGAVIATPTFGVEADDLINELSHRFKDSIVLTMDKDLLAVPGDVLLLTPKHGYELNPKKFPVPDEYIPLYRAVVTGDASDGVGSVKGFGEKTWAEMIKVLGEDFIYTLDDLVITGKVAEGLAPYVDHYPKIQLIIDDADGLKSRYKLLSFYAVPAHRIDWKSGVPVTSETLVTSHNFDDIKYELATEEFEYAVIDYESDVGDESRAWSATSGVKVDVLGQEICGMGLMVNDRSYYFSVDHRDTANITYDQLEEILGMLWGKTIYAHNAVFEQTLTYNHYEALLPNIIDTSLMASYVDENDYSNLKHLSKKYLNYQQNTYEETVGDLSGMREISGDEVLRYGLDDVLVTDSLANLFSVIMEYEGSLEAFHKVENDALYFTTYCFIYGVSFDWDKFKEMKAKNDANIKDAWDRLSRYLFRLGWPGGTFEPVANMNIFSVNKVYEAIHGEKIKGVTSVKAALEKIDDERFKEAVANRDFDALNKYYEEHWVPKAEFNIRSHAQVEKLLYGVLGIKERIQNPPTEKEIAEKGKNVATGSNATNEYAIKNAIAWKDTPHTDLLELLLEYKGYLTLESLFFEKWPKYIHWKTGKIHSSMRQSATTTRRFTHSAPNMAQLPKKKGKFVRDMIKADDDDWYLWAFDIDSQELKLQAWASQDANFLACYIGDQKRDVHSSTGVEVAQKQGHDYESYEDFMKRLNSGDLKAKSFRTLGKATNFATAYLCKAPKLSQMLCVSVEEAAAFIDAKGEAFPTLMTAIRKYNNICKERKYSVTFLGARRHLHGKGHYAGHNTNQHEAADRLSWSFNIQGSAAEQIKLSAGEMYSRSLFDDGLVRPITIIHDEIVGAIHKSVVEDRMTQLLECMCRKYADMEIETTSTPMIGRNLGSMQEYKGSV